jgi:endonuclease III
VDRCLHIDANLALRQAKPLILELLDKLARFYGRQEPCWPVDPYEFIVWWQCGYPASDATCTKGWDKLKREVGIEPHQLLATTTRQVASALKPGGMLPELRAMRVMETAMLVMDRFGGDLRAALTGPLSAARKTLKRFPGIADPGADRILPFARVAPVAAGPSNAAQVLVRILNGEDSENYVATYRQAQQAIEAEVPKTIDARTRAYLSAVLELLYPASNGEPFVGCGNDRKSVWVVSRGLKSAKEIKNKRVRRWPEGHY